MAFRFRRSMKIAPGVRLNIGKKGGSVSIGPRGAKLTTGTSGTRITGGIPGTGLSVTEKTGSGKRAGQAPRAVAGEPKNSIPGIVVAVVILGLLLMVAL
ncbi:MAG: DUF4236 domain-containing protein [Parvibaculum sp.]